MSNERCPWCGGPYETEEDGDVVYYIQHDPEECRDTLHRKLAAKNQELQAAREVVEAARETVKLWEGIPRTADSPLQKLEDAIRRYDELRGGDEHDV